MSDRVELEIHFGGGTDNSAPWVSLMPITISRRPSPPAAADAAAATLSAFFGELAQANASREMAIRRIREPIVLVPIPDQELALDRLEVPESGRVAERVVPRLDRVGQRLRARARASVDHQQQHVKLLILHLRPAD